MAENAHLTYKCLPQEDFEFLEVQTFDDKNAIVQNESNINGTFNSQFNPKFALNSNNSTKVINVQNNTETDINNYTQKSRKIVITAKEIVNFTRTDINDTLKSRIDIFNPKFASKRNNSTKIIAVLTNSEKGTDIKNIQKSRNDTFRKSMIITKGIENLNRQSVTDINSTQKSIGNKKFTTESKVLNNPQTNCNNSEIEEKLKQVIKERNELQNQLSLKEVQNEKLQEDMKQKIEEYDALKDKVKNLKNHIFNMLPILEINTNQSS